jgi:hypothetical protein
MFGYQPVPPELMNTQNTSQPPSTSRQSSGGMFFGSYTLPLPKSPFKQRRTAETQQEKTVEIPAKKEESVQPPL